MNDTEQYESDSKDLEQYNKDNVGSQKNFDTDAEGLSRGNQPSRKSKSDYEKYVSDKNNKENYSEERGWDKWGEEETYERVSAFGDSSQSETKDGRNLWGKQATKKVKITKRKPREENTVFKTSGFKSENNDTAEASPLGRFAANLLVSDDILEKDFSRYYSLDAWWEDRVKKLPEEVQRTFPFLIVPKASKSEKNNGVENNIHPTVKPLKLMNYLIALGSRKGDVVLDPFAGSGTTGIACVFSERNYILIEREKEYYEILKSRIKQAKNPAGIVQHKWF
jgi:hypothetical protein